MIDANGEVARALDDFLEGNKKRMREQREFMQEMEIFKLRLVRDLETSAKDVSETFRWLTKQATDVSQELLNELSSSLGNSRTGAEALDGVGSSRSTFLLLRRNSNKRLINRSSSAPVPPPRSPSAISSLAPTARFSTASALSPPRRERSSIEHSSSF